MSLNSDLSQVKNWSEVAESPYTQAVIFATISVGMNQITDQNCEEFYKRVNAHERALGTFLLTPDNKPHFLTLENIQRLVGLRTNASPKRLRDFIYELGKRVYEQD